MDLCRSALRRPRTWLIAVPIAVVLALVAGPFVYINFIKEDAPDRLSLDDAATTTRDRGRHGIHHRAGVRPTCPSTGHGR